MSASIKMGNGNELGFQERWELRRMDDNNSSSDDSISSLSDKADLKTQNEEISNTTELPEEGNIQNATNSSKKTRKTNKKQKLVPNPISVENGEINNTPQLPQKGNIENATNGLKKPRKPNKKQQLVPNPISVQNEEINNTPELPQEGNIKNATNGLKKQRKPNTKRKKGNLVKKDAEKKSSRKPRRKKTKISGHDEAASLPGVKIFMESLLKDLNDTRENLFSWMKDEMNKLDSCKKHESAQVQPRKNFNSMNLLAHHTTQQPNNGKECTAQNNIQMDHPNNRIGSGSKAKKCIGGSPKKCVIGQQPAYQASEKPVVHGSSGKNTIVDLELVNQLLRESHYDTVSGSKAKKCIGGSSETYTKGLKGPYSNFPYRVFENTVEHVHRSEPIPSSGNKTIVNLNQIFGESKNGYVDQLAGVSHVGSGHVNHSNRNNATSSGIGSEFSVPVYNGLNHRFSIPRRVGIENQVEENNIFLGLKMNGGDFVTNTSFHIGSNYNVDTNKLMAYQTSNLKGGHLFPS